MSMETEIVVCGVCLLAAAGTVLFYRHKLQCTYQRLGKMLSDARGGVFKEQNFDETRLFVLEASNAQIT